MMLLHPIVNAVRFILQYLLLFTASTYMAESSDEADYKTVKKLIIGLVIQFPMKVVTVMRNFSLQWKMTI